MVQNKITYFHSKTSKVEVIYCKNSNISYPDHNHISIYTIGLVLDGHFELDRKTEQTICKTGDFFIIFPYEPHAIYTKRAGYTMLSICLDKNFVKENNSGFMLSFLQELANELVRENLISVEHIILLPEAINILYTSVLSVSYTVNKSINLARKILESSSDRNISLDQLSKQISFSKYHFIRIFKEQVGLTPHRFLMQNRVRKAQHLLETDMPITEVAFASGFYDQSHFNKWFKKIIGLTPSEYLSAIMIIPNDSMLAECWEEFSK